MTKITIIGTGLMGTSMALALRQTQLRDVQLVGTDADGGARSGAQKKGAFHRVESRLMNAVGGADIVILATPVMAMKELLELLGPELQEGCLVTDVGSSKKVVLEWADQYLPTTVDFVGGHPMAGKETPGPEHADGALFQGRAYCIVPSRRARQQAVSEVTTLAEAIGSRPFFIGVDEHDSFVAAASHLPFLLSVALMGCTSKSVNWEDIAQLTSSGYRDLTRLASGDPIMHRDICLTNPESIVAWIDAFIRELYEVRKLLVDSEGTSNQEAVQGIFEQAFEARARLLAGRVTPAGRQQVSSPDIPTFSQSVGEMFAGRRLMEAQKRWFDQSRDNDRKKK